MERKAFHRMHDPFGRTVSSEPVIRVIQISPKILVLVRRNPATVKILQTLEQDLMLGETHEQ